MEMDVRIEGVPKKRGMKVGVETGMIITEMKSGFSVTIPSSRKTQHKTKEAGLAALELIIDELAHKT